MALRLRLVGTISPTNPEDVRSGDVRIDNVRSGRIAVPTELHGYAAIADLR